MFQVQVFSNTLHLCCAAQGENCGGLSRFFAFGLKITAQLCKILLPDFRDGLEFREPIHAKDGLKLHNSTPRGAATR
jgi:hypothetical protein